jgi:DNA polymerase-3 subunit beta
MKVQIEKNILENILLHANAFVEKKDTSSITSHVYIQVQNNILTLKATDYDIGFEVTTQDIEILHEGKVTANGKKLLDIVRILKNEAIILELLNDTLYIKQGASKFKLPSFAAESFPEFPTIEEKPSLTIDSQQLIGSLKKITPSIDTNNPKFELNGALIDIKQETINFVSTDTRRLSIVTLDNAQNNTELSIIIPRKAILEIQKLFFDAIEMYYDETYLIIRSSQYTFFTKLINGKFPEYSRIIPKETKYNLELPKKEIIDALKQITTVSMDVKLTFTPESMVFESLSDDNNEAKTELNFPTNFSQNFTLAVNSKYILDFLNNIDTPNFLMKLNENNHPFILEENNFKTVVMPIVI